MHLTMLAEGGTRPKYIMKRLGHKNIQVTVKIYQHVTGRISDHGRTVLNSLYKEAPQAEIA